MELETRTEVIPIDQDLQAKVQALTAEGWECAPGTLPIAVYHLIRVKREEKPRTHLAGVGGLGLLSIDESKVFVIPGNPDTKQ